MNEFSKLERDEMRKITGGVPPVLVCNIGASCYQGLDQTHTNAMFGTCTDRSPYAIGCVCDGEAGVTRSDFCFTQGEVS